MRKFLQLMLSALLALTLCTWLAACDGGTDNPSGTPTSGASIAAPTEEPTEEPVLELPPRPAVTEEDTEYLIFKKIEGKDEYSVSFDPEMRWGAPPYYTLTIPTEYDGLPVTEIAEGGFFGINIRFLYLPEKLKVIGKSAFSNNNLLTAAIMPDTVEEIGEEAFYYAGGGEVKRIDLSASLKTVGNRAFFGTGLKRVEFPASLKEIGEDAFTDLREVFIPKGVEKIGVGNFGESVRKITVEEGNAFYESINNCLIEKATNTLLCCVDIAGIPTGGKVKILERGSVGSQRWTLTEVVIPDGVEEIRKGTFSNYENLRSVTLSDTVKVVENDAFYQNNYHSNLQKVYLGKSLQKVDYCLVAFLPSLDCLKISAENIYFKKDEHSLISLVEKELLSGDAEAVIPADGSVTKIGVNAFGKAGLTSVVIPDGVTEIKEMAFAGCRNLRTVEFPAGLEKIGDYAFAKCTALTKVELFSGWTRIGESAFSGCESMTELILPDTLGEIGVSAFSGCASLETVKLSAALTKIEIGLFAGCAKLSKIVIPAGVTEIEDGAFSSCTGLREVALPEGLKIIKQAFSYCSSLKNIVLPDTVERIDSSAFSGCSALETVMLSKSLKSVSREVFCGVGTQCRIFVPMSEEEWSAVRVEDDWLGEQPTASVFYYSETRPGMPKRTYWHYGANGEPEIW